MTTFDPRRQEAIDARIAALRARRLAPPPLGELHTPRVLLTELTRNARGRMPLFAVVSDMEEDPEHVRRLYYSLN